ncbi:hypothetical protein RDABS01_021470 [Bienertia sinuspersici]
MGNYLGCPLEIDGRSTVPLGENVDKIVKCISSWKFSSLSHMGRCILINSVLVALASHIMMVYLFPRRILSKINSTILKFFWSGTLDRKPVYWVNGSTLKQRRLEGGMGIRDVESLNLALLFKQAWRLEKNQNILASRIFRQKYGGSPISLTMDNQRIKRASWGARSIVKSASILKSKVGFKIGNGQNVRILEDKWVNNSLITLKEGGPQEEAPQMVSELISNNSWNIEKVRRWFNWGIAQKVLSIHIPQYGGNDERVWLHTRHGHYSVKSGYWQIREVVTSRNDDYSFWRLFHKAPMSQRWRWFCWKLVHNALPTRHNLWKRKICSTSSCVFCGNMETSSHLLIHCEFSKRIWKACNLGINIEANEQIGVSSWFRNMFCYLFKNRTDQTQSWVSLVATIWAIWLHRNDVIFKQRVINPWNVLRIAREEEIRWNKVFNHSNLPPNRVRLTFPDVGLGHTSRMAEWSWGTQVGEVNNILIVDGAWKMNALNESAVAAFGWVLEENGNTIRSDSKRICANSPLQAECHALLRGIEAAARSWSELVVLTDSMQVILMLKNPLQAQVDCFYLIQDILFLVRSFRFVKVVKCSRAGVNKAHGLAVKARKGE